MGFLDYIVKGLGADGVYVPRAPETKARKRNEIPVRDYADAAPKRQKPAPRPIGQAPAKEERDFAIFEPVEFKEIVDLVTYLSNQRPTVINLNNIQPSALTRAVDFISGAVYALGGSMERVGDGMYLFAPRGTNLITRRGSTGKD